MVEVTVLSIFAYAISVVEVFTGNFGHLELEGLGKLSFAFGILGEAVAGDQEVRGGLAHGTFSPRG